MQVIKGFLLIILFCWYRFGIERLPNELNNHLNKTQLIIFSIIFFSMLIFFYISIKKYNVSEQNKTIYQKYFNNKLIKIIQNFILNILNNLKALDNFIKNNFKSSNQRLSYADKLCINLGLFFFFHKKKATILCLILLFLPQIILCLAFFVDVFIYNKLFYIYKLFSVIFFNFIIRYIIYSLDLFVEKNIENLNNILIINLELEKNKIQSITLDELYIIVKYNTDKEINVEYIFTDIYIEKYDLNLFSVRQFLIEKIKYFINEIFYIRIFLDDIKEYRSKFELVFNIVRYFIYSVCWCFILLYGLNFF